MKYMQQLFAKKHHVKSSPLVSLLSMYKQQTGMKAAACSTPRATLGLKLRAYSANIIANIAPDQAAAASNDIMQDLIMVGMYSFTNTEGAMVIQATDAFRNRRKVRR